MATGKEITAGLDELGAKSPSGALVDPNNAWFVTFELRDSMTKGEPFWLQIDRGMMNMQYLDEDEPSTRLKEEVDEFPEGFGLIAWDTCLYATFEIPQECAVDLSALVDRIARQYFGLQPDYQVIYRLENHGA